MEKWGKARYSPPAEFLGEHGNAATMLASTRKPMITIGVTVVPSCPIVAAIVPARGVINSIVYKFGSYIIIWEIFLKSYSRVLFARKSPRLERESRSPLFRFGSTIWSV